MSEPVRSAKEIASEQVTLIAEAEMLQTKSRTEALTDDETARLEQCIDGAEQLEKDLNKARTEERLVAVKERNKEPFREAPRFTPTVHTKPNNENTLNDGLYYWLAGRVKDGERSPESA